ncbi:MAG: hypothetical protein U9M94_01570 [Patescibacteria group bacterium]|nr:hypothetical protein [Patescibacteria group bacterium]
MEIQNQAATKLHQAKPILLTPLVVPITSNDKILEAWNNFNDLKLKLLEDSDFISIKGEKYAKKSAFRKLALAFGISTEIMREKRIELKNDGYAYEITMRASSPSGRFMSAVASCHSDERKFNKASDVRAIAQTRATNRSVADLIGWSAPSAEEMMSEPMEGTNDKPESMNDFFNKVVCDPNNKPIRKEQISKPLSEKQRSLLVSLISERVHEPEEREKQLELIDSLSKSEAHEMISEILNNKFN